MPAKATTPKPVETVSAKAPAKRAPSNDKLPAKATKARNLNLKVEESKTAPPRNISKGGKIDSILIHLFLA